MARRWCWKTSRSVSPFELHQLGQGRLDQRQVGGEQLAEPGRGEQSLVARVLASTTPTENVAAAHPEEFARLAALARGLHETSRFMMYENRREPK
jgi:hypothetical protein